MDRLPGQGMASEIPPLLCALEYGRAEWQTSDTACEMRPFVPRSGGEAGSGLPVEGRVGKQRDRVQMRVSPGSIPSLARSLLRGLCDARRHGAVLLSGLLSQSKSGPLLQNARLGTWESRPLALLRQV